VSSPRVLAIQLLAAAHSLGTALLLSACVLA
jgi:hypothetical protein